MPDRILLNCTQGAASLHSMIHVYMISSSW